MKIERLLAVGVPLRQVTLAAPTTPGRTTLDATLHTCHQLLNMPLPSSTCTCVLSRCRLLATPGYSPDRNTNVMDGAASQRSSAAAAATGTLSVSLV